MQAFLLEKPVYLVPILAFLELMFAWAWYRQRSRLRVRLAVAGIVIFPVLILIQALVVTDRERISRVCETLKRAVEQADALTFATHLSERVLVNRRNGEPYFKDELVSRFKRMVNDYHIEEARLGGVKIEVSGDSADVMLRATCRVIARDAMHPHVPSSWRLRFQREANGWRLSEVLEGKVQPGGLDIMGDAF